MDYNNNTNINKNVMGWIPINNDVSISQAKYPRLVAYIKQNFQVNKVYWDVVGGVRLVNASGLYPRFTGNHWAGFTTNPDAAGRVCGDKINYAMKYFRIYGSVYYVGGHLEGTSNLFGWGGSHMNNGHAGEGGQWGLKYDTLYFDYSLNGMPTSSNEARPKSIFFNLLIYAGYPQN